MEQKKTNHVYLLGANLLLFSIFLYLYLTQTFPIPLPIELSTNMIKWINIGIMTAQTIVIIIIQKGKRKDNFVSLIILLTLLTSWFFYFYMRFYHSFFLGEILFAYNLLSLSLISFLLEMFESQDTKKDKNRNDPVRTKYKKRWINTSLFIIYFIRLFFGFLFMHQVSSNLQFFYFLLLQDLSFVLATIVLYGVTQFKLAEKKFYFLSLKQFENLYALDTILIHASQIVSQEYQHIKTISSHYFDDECLLFAVSLAQDWKHPLSYALNEEVKKQKQIPLEVTNKKTAKNQIKGQIKEHEYCLSDQVLTPLSESFQAFVQTHEQDQKLFLYEKEQLVALLVFAKLILPSITETVAALTAKKMLCFIYSDKTKQQLLSITAQLPNCYFFYEKKPQFLSVKIEDLYKKHHRIIYESIQERDHDLSNQYQALDYHGDLFNILIFMKIRDFHKKILLQNIVLSFMFLFIQFFYLFKNQNQQQWLELQFLLIQIFQLILLLTNNLRLFKFKRDSS